MMKKRTTAGLFLFMLVFAGVYISNAQSVTAETMFKNHINSVVQKVKQAEDPKQKRVLLNTSFEKLINSLNKAKKMQDISENHLVALGQFKQDITEKKNELNGLAGFKEVPDNQLNIFADYIQQDYEQANLCLIIVIGALFILLIPSLVLGI